MRTSSLALVLTATLSACTPSPYPRPVPVTDDRAITFPQFFEHDAISVGALGGANELDGETLKAVTIAANDYLPTSGPDDPCWRRREAQLFRVIRQKNIIFIYIHENFTYCGRTYPATESGIKYAISTDGRILRRIIDAQEGGLVGAENIKSDAGFIGEPGTSPTFEALFNTPAVSGPSDGGADGGVSSGPSPSPWDGGASETH